MEKKKIEENIINEMIRYQGHECGVSMNRKTKYNIDL